MCPTGSGGLVVVGGCVSVSESQEVIMWGVSLGRQCLFFWVRELGIVGEMFVM